MSRTSDKLLAGTSKPDASPALLALEDGTAFRGTACGARGERYGEICFNTSLVGYLEVITDPSYAGQIIAMTYPQIGNYGVSLGDAQAAFCAARGLVVRDLCTTPSNWRSTESLSDFLVRNGVVAIEGVDTRALVRHIREAGAMRAVISTEDESVESLLAKVRESAPLIGENFVRTVSREKSAPFKPAEKHAGFLAPAALATRTVVAYDCGAKTSILDNLARVGCEVVAVPWDTPASEVLGLHPDGVFLSNGPGDPDAVSGTYEQVKRLLGEVPIFGICLGHQMICEAVGARIEKLAFGHHGANHPVMNLRTGRVEITVQNHGFGVVPSSLGAIIPEESGGATELIDDCRIWAERRVAPVVRNERVGRIQITHANLNDGTPEGIACLDVPAFSVQYHPEASAGPTDAHYLFSAFARLMDGCADYLDIDIAKDRLSGWEFGRAEGGR